MKESELAVETRQMACDPSIEHAQSKMHRWWPLSICSRGQGKRGKGDAAYHPGILDMPNCGRDPRESVCIPSPDANALACA